MTHPDILIIGAGAAGLLAARELARHGKKVIVLEARNRQGGRIHTLHEIGFTMPVEAGAEFIHGDLPLTLQLTREAGIDAYETSGKTWQVKQGNPEQANGFIEDWDVLIDKLKKLEQDMSMAQFLDTYFVEEKYQKLKDSVKSYLQGYDAADTSKASAFALRDEWTAEDEATQYRLKGGYSKLIAYLAKESEALGCSIHTGTIVKEIQWQPGQVKVITAQQKVYEAAKVLITVPLGVLCSEPGNEAHIQFTPTIPQKNAAFKAVGFGAVIKFILRFKEAFWETDTCKRLNGNCMPELGFLFSEEVVPTWWTQLPEPVPILTGWLAGPKAQMHKSTSDEVLLDMALTSLASLFNLSKETLQTQLQAAKVINWAADPFAQGAYAYATVQTKAVRATLNSPEADTLFFAGEAFYDGPWIGTVEAALENGRTVARLML